MQIALPIVDEQQSQQTNVVLPPLFGSLKYVLDFYFGNISPETIVSFAPKKDEEDFTIENAVDIANSIGLVAIEKDVTAELIQGYFLPCIIFDKKNNPVVLLKRTSKEAAVFDPIKNEKVKIDPNYLKNYKKAILIFRDKTKKELVDQKLSKDWFWGPVKSFWRSYTEIGILTFFINLFALAIPLFTMSVYDRVVPNNATETLFVLGTGVSIILIFDLIFKSVRNHIIEKTGKRLGLYLEEELMKRLLTLQSSYDDMMTGTKANLFRELTNVKDFFAAKSLAQIIDFPFFILALVVIFMISPMVAAVPAIIGILIILFNIFMQLPIANLSKQNIQNMQSKHSFMVENIQGSEVIKLSNATANKIFNWRNIIAMSDTIGHKIQNLNALSMNFSQTIIQFVTVLVIVVGVYEIAAKQLSVGGLIAITILAGRAMVPVINLSMMAIKFKEVKESLININEFWHLPSENEKQIEIGLARLKGDIEFKGVSYFYKNSKYASLDNVSFKIRAGEKVGIIGQTGAGKSTVLRILTGLNVPSNGSVYVDNHDITTIHPVEIRQNIGVMPQEPFLFSGSLKENIELSRPISKERMMELIQITGLDELVKKSGQGDGLQVGERGANLSVGQKHLIALARAILNEPPILILDEPTTGLDVGLEKTLVEHLKQVVLNNNKTLIVITHRFAALELVDRVIVMTNGKIVADGPRDKVLNALRGQPQ